MPSLVCPKCNYQTKENEVFCSKCGTKLEFIQEQKICNSCGKELKPGDDFCTHCGSKHKTKKGISWGFIIGLVVVSTIYGNKNRVQQAVDNEKAVKWYRMAAKQGNAAAQAYLGLCYFNGLDVEKDDKEAAKWFRLAAEQGDAMAQTYLGLCYFNGSGVEKDEKEAVKWYRMAAEQGDEDAKKALEQLGY